MPDADVRMQGFMEKTDLEVALKMLRSLVEPLDAESVRLEQALGRTLAPKRGEIYRGIVSESRPGMVYIYANTDGTLLTRIPSDLLIEVTEEDWEAQGL